MAKKTNDNDTEVKDELDGDDAKGLELVDDDYAADEYGDDDYADYERRCKQREEENDAYLDEFEEWLVASGLSDQTITRHLNNVHFFLNTYLLREDAYGMEEGCGRMDDFLGYFFIRKCMWSSPTTIKQNAASFKKFYKCMLERGHVNKKSYDYLLASIKEGMPLWLEDCERYNDPSIDYFGEEDDYPFDDFGGMDDFGGALADLLSAGDALNPYNGLLDRVLGGDGDGAKAREILSQVMDEYGVDSLVDRDMNVRLSKDEAIRTLSLALLYLTSKDDGKSRDAAVRTASTSMDDDVIEGLYMTGMIEDGDAAGTVTMTSMGIETASIVLMGLGLDYLVEEDWPEDDPEPDRSSLLRLV